MQVEDPAGYKDTDKWTRWLPEYDTQTYSSKVVLCKTAISYWYAQRYIASGSTAHVKTDIAKKRWSDRWHWSNANLNRWQNSLTDCMIQEGVLKRETVPF